MNVFRLHIRPRGGIATIKQTFEFCLENSILGVGWRVPNNFDVEDLNWNNYYDFAKTHFGKISTVVYLKNNIQINDLIWTRDNDGIYYLAKVNSPWKYFRNADSINNDIDIGNVVSVELTQVNIEDVPGKVIACFRPRRTLQKIDSKQVLEYSKYLWNQKTTKNFYDIDESITNDVFSFLDSEEIEDVIFIYLQSKDFYVIPNSRKGDTMNYEYYVINKNTQEKFLVQIKSGKTHLDIKNYKNLNDKYILFQPYNLYSNSNEINENIQKINPEEIIGFIENNLQILPNSIASKIKIISKIANY